MCFGSGYWEQQCQSWVSHSEHLAQLMSPTLALLWISQQPCIRNREQKSQYCQRLYGELCWIHWYLGLIQKQHFCFCGALPSQNNYLLKFVISSSICTHSTEFTSSSWILYTIFRSSCSRSKRSWSLHQPEELCLNIEGVPNWNLLDSCCVPGHKDLLQSPVPSELHQHLLKEAEISHFSYKIKKGKLPLRIVLQDAECEEKNKHTKNSLPCAFLLILRFVLQ